MTSAVGSFAGFSRDGVQFLADLAEHNDRAWFQPRKAEYERLLKEPLEALCEALAKGFAARGVPMSADPRRSPFRIYRDTRFSKDKTPYKTHVSASFPWVGGAADGSPDTVREREGPGGVGGYFHFQPGEIYVGGGMWHPEPTRLVGWRSVVANDPAGVRRAIDDPRFVKEFGAVHGDSLKRVPSGFPPDHPEADLLKLKDVTFGRRMSDDEALSARLPDIIVESFATASPVLALLAGLPA